MYYNLAQLLISEQNHITSFAYSKIEYHVTFSALLIPIKSNMKWSIDIFENLISLNTIYHRCFKFISNHVRLACFINVELIGESATINTLSLTQSYIQTFHRVINSWGYPTRSTSYAYQIFQILEYERKGFGPFDVGHHLLTYFSMKKHCFYVDVLSISIWMLQYHSCPKSPRYA